MPRWSVRRKVTLGSFRLQVSGMMVAAALGAACESNNPPPTPSPGTGIGETITGRERIGWDQPAADATEVSTFGYAIYVDGARSVMSGVTCGATAGAAGFPCTGPLPPLSPGAHVLEIASFINGAGVIEGPRSAAFRVTVTGSTSPAEPGGPAPLADGERVVTADGVQLSAALVADGLADLTDLALASDGRLIVAERAGCVRVIGSEGIVKACAREARHSLLAIASPPDFERSGHLFLIESISSVFRLARYRLAGSDLVERVAVLPDVPSSVDPAAALRFGPDGRLYAAFDDRGSQEAAARQSEWSGKILRINPDGRTPDDQPAASPVFWSRLASPGGLDWSPDGGMLWMADAGNDGIERIRALVVGSDRRVGQRASYVLGRDLDASSLAFYRGRAVPEFLGDLFIAATNGAYLLRVRFDAGERTRAVATEKLLERRLGNLRAVLAAPDGALYVGNDSAVWRLTPTTQAN